MIKNGKFSWYYFGTKSLYFCSTRSVESLTFKHHNSFQNKNNRKARYSFAARPLISKLGQEV